MDKKPLDDWRSGWLTVSEAQELTGWSEETLRRLARQGRVQADKIGRTWLVNRAELERYKAEVDHLETPHDPRRNPDWKHWRDVE